MFLNVVFALHIDCGTGDKGGIDLVLALDSSGSIGSDRFQFVREFAASISNVLDIGLQRSLVGLFIFSTRVRLQFAVTDYTDKASLLTAINNIRYRPGATRTERALKYLRDEGESGGRLKLRDGYTHVAILLTDGNSTFYNLTKIAAAELHASGIYDRIYAVGIKDADINELRNIASDNSYVFFTSTFDGDSIKELQDNVTEHLKPCFGKLYGHQVLLM